MKRELKGRLHRGLLGLLLEESHEERIESWQYYRLYVLPKLSLNLMKRELKEQSVT